ncbi:D-alanyl-D-alanine carboxypeptidase family protein [Woodsholea maritima]|uniref:D-alanyl-D-alanine carboxypeptidase family protein n=1 Tax=Woodsholea maritima TaxID=240237 RepID=UPI00047701C4|nr:D-alanyl-D-alanine carboxypeptidase family protein [Woodsholea maritima]
MRFVSVVSALSLGMLTIPASLAQSPAFETRASHAVIMDAHTGIVLFNKDGDVAMPPASMSKLMTTLMAFEAIENGRLSLDDELMVSENAWRKGGVSSGSSTMFLEPNTRVKVSDLLRGIIVQSGNDACIVIAEALEGTEDAFAEAMTHRAQELGLTSATFANSTGWPHEDHRISARDLAEVARIIIEDHPEFYELYNEGSFTYNGITQSNRNPLLGVVEGADGLKTGHTEESGYGLVGSAVRDDTRRIIVFNGMGSMRDRASEAERLMRAAFSDFEVYTLGEAGEVLAEADVFMGHEAKIGLVLPQSLTLGMHRREYRDFTAHVEFEGPVTAPIQQGDVLGHLIVDMGEGREERIELQAEKDIARKGLFGRAGDALLYLIRGR